MEIQSAFNSGVQGFQKAVEDANKAAANIVTQTTASEENLAVEQGVNKINEVQSTTSNDSPSLTQSIVDLKVAEFQAKTSSEVIQSADEVLGTLLDVRV